MLAKGIPLPLASVSNLRSLIYLGNFVDALVICATHPAAAGQTYLVSDGEDVSTPELLRQLGAAMGHPARLLPCPPALLKMAGRVLGRSEQLERLLGSLQVDSSKIRSELGWQPPFTLQQGLQATAEWYRITIARTSKNTWLWPELIRIQQRLNLEYTVLMPTILLTQGFRFFFFSQEGSEPPHVHVEHGDKVAKYWLYPVELSSSEGFRSHELKKVRLLVIEHRELFMEKWNEHFSN